MNRTLRAAFVADLIGLFGVGGIALFLGVPFVTSVITGAVAGTLFFVLIFAAAKRSEGFEDRQDDLPEATIDWPPAGEGS